jgi:hypothetical protein
MSSEEPPKLMPDGTEVIGLDGTHWVLEGADRDRYHVVDRWFVEDYPAYERACLCLVELSGLESSGRSGDQATRESCR